MNKILVTSYINPDVDGVACAMAYAELLNAQGKNAEAGFFGEILHDVAFVANHADVKLQTIDDASTYDKIILVDVSRTFDIHESINPKSVIEIVDHRKIAETEEFINAKIQLELVASCATLIAEKKMQLGKTQAPGWP